MRYRAKSYMTHGMWFVTKRASRKPGEILERVASSSHKRGSEKVDYEKL